MRRIAALVLLGLLAFAAPIAAPLNAAQFGWENPVSYTDRSGTITSGGVAQVLMAANATRAGYIIQNVSTGDLWISSLGTAAATQPSIWLPPGSYYEPSMRGVPFGAISIFGATTGQAFTAREW